MLSLVLYVVCLVCLWLKYGRAWVSNGHVLPPVLPGALPLVGHTHILLTDPSTLWDQLKTTAEDCVRQGGVSYMIVGREIYYLIADPQDALTAANSCMVKHFGFDFAKVWMGDGLLTSSGEMWKRHRKLLNPSFNLPVIHGFLEVFNNQSKKLVSDVEPHLGKGLFDHLVYLRNIALETLCVGTFGINAIDDRTFTKKFMKCVDEILILLTRRVTQFWLQSDLVYKLLGLKKREAELLDTLNTMANKIMHQKKAAMEDKALNNNIECETTGLKYRPFLDLLLQLSANGDLTDKDIRDEIHTTIAAGFETTSNQLTFILLQLGANPEVQEKVHQELLEVLGAERDVEKDDLNKLIYTNAVIMESLRVFPSVPALLRYVDKDVKLKNYTMRAGSECIIYPLATHLDPCWGPQSDQFRPERWLNNDVCNNKEFAAFGLGKRACIGRTYAMISMKVTLAHFLRRYRVKADMNKLRLKYDFVLKPDSGHEISIESRT